MLVGVPKETKKGEYRVGLTDSSVSHLIQQGNKVILERGAGLGAGIEDSQYSDAGAVIVSSAEEVFQRSELIVKVKEPSLSECSQLKAGQIIFCYLHLAAFPEQARSLCDSGVTAIAFETVVGKNDRLPLLVPMSKIAGRVGMQSATYYLQRHLGGRGLLLGGEDGETTGKVVIIGGGTAGESAAKVAIGMGANIVVFDKSASRIDQLRNRYGHQLDCLFPDDQIFREQICDAEIVVGSVLIPGASAPKLINRELLSCMKKGAVIVDIAIDQGGCFETSHPTTHDNPVYVVDDILHYCVANIPSAVPLTSTHALNRAILPYVTALAEDGADHIAESANHPLHTGLNVHKGAITCQAVADAL